MEIHSATGQEIDTPMSIARVWRARWRKPIKERRGKLQRGRSFGQY